MRYYIYCAFNHSLTDPQIMHDEVHNMMNMISYL